MDINQRDKSMKIIGKSILLPLVLLPLILLTGCASVGKQFDINAVSVLVSGETTYSEAVQALGGEPTARKVNEDGTEVYRWLWSRASLAGSAADSIVLLFDSNGLFVKELGRSSL